MVPASNLYVSVQAVFVSGVKSSPEALFERPQKRRTDRVVVASPYTISGMAFTEILYDRNEGVRFIQSLHGGADHLHKFATLVLHVSLEEGAQGWIQFEKPLIK